MISSCRKRCLCFLVFQAPKVGRIIIWVSARVLAQLTKPGAGTSAPETATAKASEVKTSVVKASVAKTSTAKASTAKASTAKTTMTRSATIPRPRTVLGTPAEEIIKERSDVTRTHTIFSEPRCNELREPWYGVVNTGHCSATWYTCSAWYIRGRAARRQLVSWRKSTAPMKLAIPIMSTVEMIVIMRTVAVALFRESITVDAGLAKISVATAAMTLAIIMVVVRALLLVLLSFLLAFLFLKLLVLLANLFALFAALSALMFALATNLSALLLALPVQLAPGLLLIPL